MKMLYGENEISPYFDRLKILLYPQGFAELGVARLTLPPRSRTLFFESGRISPGQRYFYVKPLNQKGWLFEETQTGWIISRSEKIVTRDLFLRKGDPWDSAILYQDPKRKDLQIRVSSTITEGEMVSFPVYERLLQKSFAEDNREDNLA